MLQDLGLPLISTDAPIFKTNKQMMLGEGTIERQMPPEKGNRLKEGVTALKSVFEELEEAEKRTRLVSAAGG